MNAAFCKHFRRRRRRRRCSFEVWNRKATLPKFTISFNTAKCLTVFWYVERIWIKDKFPIAVEIKISCWATFMPTHFYHRYLIDKNVWIDFLLTNLDIVCTILVLAHNSTCCVFCTDSSAKPHWCGYLKCCGWWGSFFYIQSQRRCCVSTVANVRSERRSCSLEKSLERGKRYNERTLFSRAVWAWKKKKLRTQRTC